MDTLINRFTSNVPRYLFGGVSEQSPTNTSENCSSNPSIAGRTVSFGRDFISGDPKSACLIFAVAAAARYILLQSTWTGSLLATAQVAAVTPLAFQYGAIGLAVLGGFFLARRSSDFCTLAAGAAGILVGSRIALAGQRHVQAGLDALEISPTSSRLARLAVSTAAVGAASFTSYNFLSYLQGDGSLASRLTLAAGLGYGAYRTYSVLSESNQETPSQDPDYLESISSINVGTTSPVQEIGYGVALEAGVLAAASVGLFFLVRRANAL
jgi:hypothetical protein